MRLSRTFNCTDCGTERPAMFTLLDSVWLSIAKKEEILCCSCTERRLGRLITGKDLKNSGITQSMRFGVLIYSREER